MFSCYLCYFLLWFLVFSVLNATFMLYLIFFICLLIFYTSFAGRGCAPQLWFLCLFGVGLFYCKGDLEWVKLRLIVYCVLLKFVSFFFTIFAFSAYFRILIALEINFSYLFSLLDINKALFVAVSFSTNSGIASILCFVI